MVYLLCIYVVLRFFLNVEIERTEGNLKISRIQFGLNRDKKDKEKDDTPNEYRLFFVRLPKSFKLRLG